MGNIRSMTGYGKGEYNDGLRNVIAEIKTINNRYTDINIKAPRHLRFFEDNIRKLIKSSVYRGRIDVFLNIEYLSESDTIITPNLALARQYKNAIDIIGNDLGYDDGIKLETLIKFQDVLVAGEKSGDTDELRVCVEGAINMAIDNLISMRETEGQQLKNDVLNGVEQIKILVDEIRKYSGNLVDDYKEKLITRVTELLGSNYELDENRLYNEIVFYTDKSDVNEELIRLNSHIEQLEDTVSEGGPVGRKFDFILQEANREINTIGSKVGNLDITKNVIEIKNTLEKIREQVQNIE